MEDVGKEVKANKKFNEKYSPFVASKNLLRKKGTSGITLIALVITIIVLLILAAVSIATLTGDNGILTQAQRAQTANDKAQAEEEMKLVVAEWQLEKKTNSNANLKEFLEKKVENGELDKVTENEDGNYTVERNGYEGTINKDGELEGEVIASDKEEDPPPPPEKKLQLGEIAEKTEKDNYVDGNNKTATIPEGFKVSEAKDEETQEYTEDKVDTGLVVIAPDGSEFVWVPVENAIAEDENDGNTKKAMAVQDTDGINYRGLLYDFQNTASNVQIGCTSTSTLHWEPAYFRGASWHDLDANKENNPNYFDKDSLNSEYKEMIESVEQYKGFYVGRYETSIKDNIVASKKGQTPISAVDENQMWYGMYNKQKSYASNIKVNEKQVVESSMIWGCQYDAMLNWILKGNDASKVTADSIEHEKTMTGSTSDDVMNKIYDLGNNLREWTLEAHATNFRVDRGGSFGNAYSPSHRSSNTPTRTDDFYGSRLTLYIK